MDLEDKISNAKWILERNLSWISAADTKITALITINLAMSTILATLYFSSNTKNIWMISMSLGAFLLILASLICIWFVVVSRISCPYESNIFFGKIAQHSRDKFCENILKMTNNDLLNDLLRQIHINSKIATYKHKFVRRAYLATMFSLLPWLSSVVMLKEML
jgi:hypothetical protein